MKPTYLDFVEACIVARVSRNTMKKWIRKGVVRFFQPGGRGTAYRFPIDFIERRRPPLRKAA